MTRSDATEPRSVTEALADVAVRIAHELHRIALHHALGSDEDCSYCREWAAATPDPATAVVPDVEDLMDFVAMAQYIRAEHEATHGEAEMCGAECIVLGLNVRAEGRGALDVWVAEAQRGTEHWVELFEAHNRHDDLSPIFERHVAEAGERIRAALAQREPAESHDE